MTKYFDSVKNKKNKFKAFKVPEEVSIYIQQLETAIKFPKESKLKELYPERFK